MSELKCRCLHSVNSGKIMIYGQKCTLLNYDTQIICVPHKCSFCLVETPPQKADPIVPRFLGIDLVLPTE
jgi:hypothetical protein